MFVISNVVSAIVDIIQPLVQSNSRWILQLISGILKIFKNYSNILVEQLFTFLNTALSSSDSGLKKTWFVFKSCWIIYRNIIMISSICYRWFIFLSCHKLPEVSGFLAANLSKSLCLICLNLVINNFKLISYCHFYKNETTFF